MWRHRKDLVLMLGALALLGYFGSEVLGGGIGGNSVCPTKYESNLDGSTRVVGCMPQAAGCGVVPGNQAGCSFHSGASLRPVTEVILDPSTGAKIEVAHAQGAVTVNACDCYYQVVGPYGGIYNAWQPISDPCCDLCEITAGGAASSGSHSVGVQGECLVALFCDETGSCTANATAKEDAEGNAYYEWEAVCED